jgi:uncharacterized membrane protein
MIVPPFIPEPLEVPGNVTEQPYLTRVAFVRRVVIIHTLTVFISIVWAVYGPTVAPSLAIFALVGSLLVMTAVRMLFKKKRYDHIISAILSPFLLGSVASLLALGTPWLAVVGPLAIATYVLACGRDLSYIAMGGFGMLAALIGYPVLISTSVVPRTEGLWWMLGTIGYVLFFVYDLAMLTRRRRLNESAGAVIDLYRDVLNFVSYPLRVRSHWKKHRIWTLRLEVGDMRALAWRAVDIMGLREAARRVRQGKSE